MKHIKHIPAYPHLEIIELEPHDGLELELFCRALAVEKVSQGDVINGFNKSSRRYIVDACEERGEHDFLTDNGCSIRHYVEDGLNVSKIAYMYDCLDHLFRTRGNIDIISGYCRPKIKPLGLYVFRDYSLFYLGHHDMTASHSSIFEYVENYEAQYGRLPDNHPLRRAESDHILYYPNWKLGTCDLAQYI